MYRKTKGYPQNESKKEREEAMVTSNDSNYTVTPTGLNLLKIELESLRNRRREMVTLLQGSKGLGDSDNVNTQDELLRIEKRILTLENLMDNSIVSTPDVRNPKIEFGDRVTILNENDEEEAFVIVSIHEANPGEGLISIQSPIGKALLGRKIKDTVQVRTPSGVRKLTIIGMGNNSHKE